MHRCNDAKIRRGNRQTMSILADVKELLEPLNVPIAAGIYKGNAPDTYIVLVPLSDTFELHADNLPNAEVQELRISIYTKGNYKKLTNQIVKKLINAEFTVTDRRYIGYETETDYFHYVVDIAKNYELEE